MYLFIAILPGPLWPGVAANDKVISVGQIGQSSITTLK